MGTYSTRYAGLHIKLEGDKEASGNHKRLWAYHRAGSGLPDWYSNKRVRRTLC